MFYFRPRCLLLWQQYVETVAVIVKKLTLRIDRPLYWDYAVRRENFISTNFGVTLEQRANTIITDALTLLL